MVVVQRASFSSSTDPAMGVIATFLPTSAHLLRLRTAIRDRHEVVVCEDWGSLVHACERQAARVAVVDLFADGTANFPAIRQLKHRMPRLTLIAYVSFTAERAHDLFHAGRQGMDALILADQDDAPRVLLATVEQAESRSLGALVRLALDGIDPTARDALLLAVTRAHQRLSPESLARLLALPKRTVSQRLARAGFPPPQRLLSWGRLIVAAHLLEDPQRSAGRVVGRARFSIGRRVSESVPALPRGDAERDSGARRRGVRSRDRVARDRRAHQGARALCRAARSAEIARKSGGEEAERRNVQKPKLPKAETSNGRRGRRPKGTAHEQSRRPAVSAFGRLGRWPSRR